MYKPTLKSKIQLSPCTWPFNKVMALRLTYVSRNRHVVILRYPKSVHNNCTFKDILRHKT